jgi:hypothetical protein
MRMYAVCPVHVRCRENVQMDAPPCKVGHAYAVCLLHGRGGVYTATPPCKIFRISYTMYIHLWLGGTSTAVGALAWRLCTIHSQATLHSLRSPSSLGGHVGRRICRSRSSISLCPTDIIPHATYTPSLSDPPRAYPTGRGGECLHGCTHRAHTFFLRARATRAAHCVTASRGIQ